MLFLESTFGPMPRSMTEYWRFVRRRASDKTLELLKFKPFDRWIVVLIIGLVGGMAWLISEGETGALEKLFLGLLVTGCVLPFVYLCQLAKASWEVYDDVATQLRSHEESKKPRLKILAWHQPLYHRTRVVGGLGFVSLGQSAPVTTVVTEYVLEIAVKNLSEVEKMEDVRVRIVKFLERGSPLVSLPQTLYKKGFSINPSVIEPWEVARGRQAEAGHVVGLQFSFSLEDDQYQTAVYPMELTFEVSCANGPPIYRDFVLQRDENGAPRLVLENELDLVAKSEDSI